MEGHHSFLKWPNILGVGSMWISTLVNMKEEMRERVESGKEECGIERIRRMGDRGEEE